MVSLRIRYRSSSEANTNKRWQPADAATLQAVAAGVESAAPAVPAPPVPDHDGQGQEGEQAEDRTRVISADRIRAATHQDGGPEDRTRVVSADRIRAAAHRAGGRP